MSGAVSPAISHSKVRRCAVTALTAANSAGVSVGAWPAVARSEPLRRKYARYSAHRARSTAGSFQQMLQSYSSSSRSGIGPLRVRPSCAARVDPGVSTADLQTSDGVGMSIAIPATSEATGG